MPANSTNLTSTPPKGNITNIELWIHLTIFYTFLCGIVSTIGNMLILIGLVRSKKLRNRFFVTIGTLTICRTLLCIQFLIVAIYRILRTLKLAPSILDRATCHAIHFWLMIGLTVEMLLLLMLVFDRAIAILATSYYRMLTMKHAVIMCTTVFFLGVIIKLPFSYTGIVFSERVTCTNSYSAPSASFNSYSQNIDLALLIITLIVYLSLLGIVRHRVHELAISERNETNATSITLKRQLKLMPMLRNLVFAHCGLALVSKILRSMAGMHDLQSEASVRFTAYGGVFSTFDLFFNMIALLWSNNEIRQASLPWCQFLHSNSTTPAERTNLATVIKSWKMTKVVKITIIDIKEK